MKIKRLESNNLKMNHEMFNHFKKSFEVLYKQLVFHNSNYESLDLKFYFNIIDRIEKSYNSRGELDNIRLIKQLKTSVIKFTAGDKMPCFSFFSTYHDGLPKIIGPEVAHQVRIKNLFVIRLLLTCFQISYLMKELKEPTLESISDMSTASTTYLSTFEEWWTKIGKKTIKSSPKEWHSLHYTTKSGPLGPAFLTNVDELFLLPDTLVRNIKIIGGSKLSIYMDKLLLAKDELRKFRNKTSPKGFKTDVSKTSLRKITYVAQPEGKARVIAIIDYWSQTALKPVHDWAFALLRTIPMDCTFNQSSFKSKLNDLKGPYWSFDLSKATDRFPIKFQEIVLSVLWSKEYASAWKHIMIDYEFHVDWLETKVSYNSGQPMGAYSSWSVFALCHHILIKYVASQVGIPNFTSYVILGDDVVIANEKVAKGYKEAMTLLGVTINLEKSLVSLDTFEFAKRLFTSSTEITAFPLSAMVEQSDSVSAMWSTLRVASERGYAINSTSIPGFVARLQNANGKHFRLSYRQVKNLECFRILQIGKSHEDYIWAVKSLLTCNGINFSCNMRDESLSAYALQQLAYHIWKFKGTMQERLYRKFKDLTSEAMYFSLNYRALEYEDSQSNSSLLKVSEYPLVLIIQSLLKESQQEMELLRVAMDDEAYEDLIRLKVSPIGNLDKIISRQANKIQLSRHDAMFKFVKQEQAKINDLIITCLQDGDITRFGY